MPLFKCLLSCLLFAFSGAAISTQPIAYKEKSVGEKICAIYPHLKDSYWLSINYGMVSEAEHQNITLKVFESGGYTNQTRQEQQLVDCVEWGADAIILGTVDPNAYSNNLTNWVGSTPVFSTVNPLTLNEEQSDALKGSVGIDWYDIGFNAGSYLTQKHPKGSGKTNAVLLLGPKFSSTIKPMTHGFYEAIEESDIEVVASYMGDNDKQLQRNLVQKVIDMDNIDYIVGNAVAIETAISELRRFGETYQTQLISTYLNHGVYRGLLRNKVEFASTDRMVEQGRLSIIQAISYLREEPFQKHISPEIDVLTPATLTAQIISESLSPSEFRPKFTVN